MGEIAEHKCHHGAAVPYSPRRLTVTGPGALDDLEREKAKKLHKYFNSLSALYRKSTAELRQPHVAGYTHEDRRDPR